jgi:hypothetical protein
MSLFQKKAHNKLDFSSKLKKSTDIKNGCVFRRVVVCYNSLKDLWCPIFSMKTQHFKLQEQAFKAENA